MKFLLFTILLSSPVFAMDICHLSQSMQIAVADGLRASMDREKQHEEAYKIVSLFKEQGCSALKPYKKDQITDFQYYEDYDDYPLSEANDLFKQYSSN